MEALFFAFADDLARLQRGETLFRGQRRELDSIRVTKDSGGDSAAGVDVDARPLALVVGLGETCEPGCDAALDMALLLDCVQCRAGKGCR